MNFKAAVGATRDTLVDYDDAQHFVDNDSDGELDENGGSDGASSTASTASDYDDDIDDVFLLTTNDEAKRRALLTRPALREHAHDGGGNATSATLVACDAPMTAVARIDRMIWLLLVEPNGAVAVYAIEPAVNADAYVVTPMARSAVVVPPSSALDALSRVRVAVCMRCISKPLQREGAREMVSVPYAIVLVVVHELASSTAMHAQKLYLEVSARRIVFFFFLKKKRLKYSMFYVQF